MTGQMAEHWSPNPNWVADGNPAEYAYLPHHNFEDFFQTGYNIANTLTITIGNENIETLFTYTNTNARGIVETNKLKRHNFNLRLDGNLAPKLHFDAKLTYMRQHVHNRLSTGDLNNPMRAIYRQPSNISLEQVRDFEYFDDAGIRLQHYWNPMAVKTQSKRQLKNTGIHWVEETHPSEELTCMMLPMHAFGRFCWVILSD
jgi:hypothetical protein